MTKFKTKIRSINKSRRIFLYQILIELLALRHQRYESLGDKTPQKPTRNEVAESIEVFLLVVSNKIRGAKT